MNPWLLACALIGYLLGCFSTGSILSGLSKVDIRALGSKSTGATNVTRVMGLRSGLITFFGDMLKAAIAVLLGWAIAGRDGGLIGALFAVIGHNWPVFYDFKGGKGVACSVAILLLCTPWEGLIAGALAIAVIALNRYVSLGSLTMLLVAALLVPISRGIWPVGAWAILLFLLGAYQHRSNIDRLLKGKENKFTGRKQQ